MRLGTVLGVAVLAARAAAIPGQSTELPRSTLRVRDAGAWVTWWTSTDAPTRWGGAGGGGDSIPLARRLRWNDEGNGLGWGVLQLAGDGEAWRTRLVVARLDPRRVRLELDTAFAEQRAAWTVERMSRPAFADVILAVNAGQFVQALPEPGQGMPRRVLFAAMHFDSQAEPRVRHEVTMICVAGPP